MADYVPNTIVRVLKDVPLDDTYTDVIKFTSIGAQTSYFAGKAKYSFTDFTYQRVNSSVAQPRGPLSCRVPEVADNLYDCNYIMFQNSNYGQKWFYAFIKQVNYVNPNNTEIIYELDHYQTWLFDFTVHECFVEREHYISDSGSEPLFVSLQPEPVSIGEYFCDNVEVKYFGLQNVIVATSTDPTGKTVNGSFYGAIYSGCQYHEFAGGGGVNALLSEYANEGTLDAVVQIQQSPLGASGVEQEEWAPEAGHISVGDALDGYAPRNKKLLSYPYLYLNLSNCDGDSVTLYPQVINESGTDVQLRCKIVKVGGIPPSIVTYPLNYGKGHSLWGNHDFAIQVNDIPPSCFTGNAYANWMAQNSQKLAVKAIASVIGMGASAISGNLAGFGASALGAADMITDISKAQMVNIPKVSGQPINSNYNIQMNRIGFEIKKYCVLKENAECIDQFFDAFGYATNKLKVPNMEGREKWNYVKTRGAIISGSLPVEAMARIKQMFNDGVRFWHGELTRNLNQPNPIVPKEARAHVEQRSIQTPFNASL